MWHKKVNYECWSKIVEKMSTPSTPSLQFTDFYLWPCTPSVLGFYTEDWGLGSKKHFLISKLEKTYFPGFLKDVKKILVFSVDTLYIWSFYFKYRVL